MKWTAFHRRKGRKRIKIDLNYADEICYEFAMWRRLAAGYDITLAQICLACLSPVTCGY